MSVIFEGIEMPTACCSQFEHCKFYNICEKRDTIRINCKPSDCPVKALEQEPTTKNDLGTDCISREQAVKTIQRYGVGCFDADEFSPEECERFVIAKLSELPPVTPQEPRWIPVNEKLPNDRDWYLGIFKEPDTGWINPLPFICDYVGHETKATTKEHWILRGFTDIDKPCDYYLNLECVAWMSLPQAYGKKEK